MQSYTTHRDPDVFSDPECFEPSRWFKENVTEEMNELFMPFSKGARVCLGVNLAYMELKIITAVLLRKYHVQVSNTDVMEIKGNFASFPKRECSLIFNPIDNTQFTDTL